MKFNFNKNVSHTFTQADVDNNLNSLNAYVDVINTNNLGLTLTLQITCSAGVTNAAPVISNLNSDSVAWPGVGRMAVGAITSNDFPLAQGAILILAVGFMVVNLIVDVLYAYLDPRIARS